MIIESVGLLKSLFPFIKELFLWRDGAEIGKPITKKNLVRRKIATYVLIASLMLNYFTIVKIFRLAGTVITLKKELKMKTTKRADEIGPVAEEIAKLKDKVTKKKE